MCVAYACGMSNAHHVRISVNLNGTGKAALDRAVQRTGFNYTDTVHRALQLYDRVVQELDDGGHLLLERDGRTCELIIT